MQDLTNKQIKSHLRTLYRGQRDLLEWLRDVASSLEDVSRSIRDLGLDLPQDIRTKIDVMDAALDRAQVGDLALEVIDSHLGKDGELAQESPK
jgi:cell wall assembly regulator SMI1